MSDPKEPYPIAPDTPGTPSSATPAGAEPRAKAADLKAKLNVSGLLDDFEEDADFDKDPELEAKVTGKPRSSLVAPEAPAAPPAPEFIKDGRLQPKHWGAIGGVLVLGAVTAAGIYAPNHAVARILLTLYDAFIQTGTGIVALYAAARLLEMRFGNLEQGATRMFTAVGLFMLLWNLDLKPFGADYSGLNRAVMVVIAVAAYGLTVAASFRLWDKQKFGFVVGFHAVLWMVVEVGMQLAATVASAATTAPRPPG